MRRAALIALFLVIATAAAVLWRRHASDPLASLQSDHRVVEAQLTAFGYQSLRVLRSAAADLRTSAIISALQQQVERERTPENLHRLALAHLAAGQARDAKRLLGEAAQLQSSDAAILSDLAAAEMALGHIFDAAEHSAEALHLDSSQSQAAFNWALALEKLSNRTMAIEAWEQYLLLDDDSGWADEARQHLATLREPRSPWEVERLLLRPGVDAATVERLVRQFPYRSRARSHNILLPQWVESGNPEQLAVLRSIAVLHTAMGDPFLQDLVEDSAARRNEVKDAVRLFGKAFDTQKTDLTEAHRLYGQATVLLDQVQSPLAITAAIYAARDADPAEKPALLEALDQRLAPLAGRYPSMLCDVEWIRAMFLFQRGEPTDCLRAFQRALDQSTRAGEIENQASIAAIVATQMEIAGDPAEAERYRIDNLRFVDATNPHPDATYATFIDTSFSAIRAGRPRVALAFIEVQSRIAQALANPLLIAESESQRALAILGIGDAASAAQHLATAEPYALQLRGHDRDRVSADIEYIRGLVELRSRPAAALAAFTAAIDVWDANHWRLHSAHGRMARADAALATGDRRAAERDYREGIEEMEEQRRNLEEPAMRVAYFENADALFQRLIALLVDEGRPADALSIAEQKRARVLLDQIASAGKAGATPLDGDAIAAAVDAQTAIVEMALLDRGAEIWVARGGRVVHARSTATRSQVEEAVTRHLAAIAADDDNAVRTEGRWLYNQLLAPVAHELEGGPDLVIVPDGVLQAFPFATLVMPDGEYLIDQYTLATEQSASVFLRPRQDGGATSLLAVAQPAPDGFDALPGAAQEAIAIAGHHRQGRAFVGDEISAREFLELAGETDVVHFAGHARTDVDVPARSGLVFEDATGAATDLTAKTIAGSRLRRHPLIVLAACSTGRGKLRRNEGIDSLAAAFLQAGARGVVATLWDVEDRSSAALFDAFHEHLRAGERPVDALRNAQRTLLRGTDPALRKPGVWGSVFVTGSR